eukprot:jgi/Hompol1/5182/HPOL_001916-RA
MHSLCTGAEAEALVQRASKLLQPERRGRHASKAGKASRGSQHVAALLVELLAVSAGLKPAMLNDSLPAATAATLPSLLVELAKFQAECGGSVHSGSSSSSGTFDLRVVVVPSVDFVFVVRADQFGAAALALLRDRCFVDASAGLAAPALIQHPIPAGSLAATAIEWAISAFTSVLTDAKVSIASFTVPEELSSSCSPVVSSFVQKCTRVQQHPQYFFDIDVSDEIVTQPTIVM